MRRISNFYSEIIHFKTLVTIHVVLVQYGKLNLSEIATLKDSSLLNSQDVLLH
jgi:hypothetical protein